MFSTVHPHLVQPNGSVYKLPSLPTAVALPHVVTLFPGQVSLSSHSSQPPPDKASWGSGDGEEEERAGCHTGSSRQSSAVLCRVMSPYYCKYHSSVTPPLKRSIYGKAQQEKIDLSLFLCQLELLKKTRLMWFNTICLFFPSSLDNFIQFEKRTPSFQTQENSYQFSVKTDGCGQEKDCVSVLLSPSGKRLQHKFLCYDKSLFTQNSPAMKKQHMPQPRGEI